MVHDRLHVGVVEQVAQLVLHVAVVHVHRDGADLERREHALEVLDRVVEVERDVVARPDALVREVVGETVHPLVDGRIGETAFTADQRLGVGDGVGHPLPQVREVEFHVSLVPPAKRSEEVGAAVDRDGGTDHEARQLGAEEHHDRRDLLGQAHAPMSFDAP